MGSIDLKPYKPILSIIAIAGSIAGVGTIFVTQQKLLTQEMGHIAKELGEIASNTKAQAVLSHQHTTTIAELQIRLSIVEKELGVLRAAMSRP